MILIVFIKNIILQVCEYVTSNKNIHFEMILDVGIGERKQDF